MENKKETLNYSRNIEIKARIHSENEFQEKIKISENLTNTKGELIKQHDVFFKSLSGRLKLRYLENTKSELIYYDRPNSAGPKLSKYNKTLIDDPRALEQILTESIGVRGHVKKVRLLFLKDTTRIHLDKVESLGTFLEFEVGLHEHQTIEEGQVIAEKFMKIFCIKKEDLMTSAYMDELA